MLKLVVILFLLGLIPFALALWKQHRRHKIRSLPFPGEWEQILNRNVALYGRLPEELRGQLRGHVRVILAEKNFEGCGGLELTDEIRVTIAAQASVLLLNRPSDYYPRLASILVYPASYVPRAPDDDERLDAPDDVRLGESWNTGIVVLSWDDALRGASDRAEGHNVVLHEFAHQLDQEDGEAQGAPVLPSRNAYRSWARVLRKEFERHRRRTRRGKRTVMDSYGAKDPAEFFAVATEAFFEKPRQLKERHSALYEELSGYYRLDPAAWWE